MPYYYFYYFFKEMDVKFAAMHRTVLLLKKYNQSLPDETQELFNAAPGRWNNLKTKVSLAKQRLGPRIQEESDRITKVCSEYLIFILINLIKKINFYAIYNICCK